MQQISLSVLNQALGKVAELGQGETTFQVGEGGSWLTLRIMTPEQDVEVQRYCAGVLGTGDDNSDMQEYLARFRLALLSHAIVAIDDLDFRNVKYIETDEEIEGQPGKKVKIPKEQALRKVLLSWTDTLRVLVFRKYTELLAKVERKAEKLVSFEALDEDSEIERLRKRIQELETAKQERLKQTEESVVGRIIKTMEGADREEQIQREQNLDRQMKAAVQVPEVELDPEQLLPPPQRVPQGPRVPILPQQAPPPGAMPARAPSQPPQQQRMAPPPVSLRVPEETDSFVDASDSDELAAQIAEEERILRERRQHFQPGPQNPTRAPHAAARLASSQVYGGEGIVAAEPLDGVETYRMPREDLGETTQIPGAPVKPLTVNQVGAGSRNPRFDPRRG